MDATDTTDWTFHAYDREVVDRVWATAREVAGNDSALQARAGGTILAPALTTLDRVDLTLTATGTLPTAQITAVTAGSITVTGGAPALTGLTTVDGVDLFVTGGGTLALPNVTAFSGVAPRHTTFQASGAGSVLDLSKIATLNGGLGSRDDPAKVADKERQARSHYGLALNHLREGRTGIAIRELLAAQALSPSDPWIDLSLAEAYRLKGHSADSERHLKRALELRPDLHAAKLNLSALYIQSERYEEAVKMSQELLADATFPVPWKALTNQGYALYKLGRNAEARQAFDHAHEYHERFWPARLDLAILDAEEGRRLEALEPTDPDLAVEL